MSEYQYYEFRAIDRPLDERAMAALRRITSRAEITPTRLINEYHFGDFKGNPDSLMDKYFDAFVYVANWGTRRLMFRLPRAVFDPASAKPYGGLELLTVRTTKQHVVLDFHSDDEGDGGWEEGEGWLSALVPLRGDLLAGDLRCLYLGWLAGIEGSEEEAEADTLEPSVPPGLGKLSAPLKELVDFLRLDPALVRAAGTASSGKPLTGPSKKDMAAWVVSLPEAEKNRFLLRVVNGEAAHLGNELLQGFHKAQRRSQGRPRGGSASGERRTIQSLLEAREKLAGKAASVQQ